MAKPVDFMWDGEAMLPEHRFKPLCIRQFVVGEKYRLAPVEDRSSASHRHYFACVREAWKNLPERLSTRFNSPEALRKHALIKCGYAETRSTNCKTEDEARKMAAIIASFVHPFDPYVEIEIVPRDNGTVDVMVYTAESQAYGAQKNSLFQQAKRDVLEFIAALIGVELEKLEAEARKAEPHHEDERERNPVGAQ